MDVDTVVCIAAACPVLPAWRRLHRAHALYRSDFPRALGATWRSFKLTRQRHILPISVVACAMSGLLTWKLEISAALFVFVSAVSISAILTRVVPPAVVCLGSASSSVTVGAIETVGKQCRAKGYRHVYLMPEGQHFPLRTLSLLDFNNIRTIDDANWHGSLYPLMDFAKIIVLDDTVDSGGVMSEKWRISNHPELHDRCVILTCDERPWFYAGCTTCQTQQELSRELDRRLGVSSNGGS